MMDELIRDIDEIGMDIADERYLPAVTLFIMPGKNESPKKIGRVDVVIKRDIGAEMKRELDNYTFEPL